jgi:hypothetical protein
LGCSPYGRSRWRVLDIAAQPFGLGLQVTLLGHARGAAGGILIPAKCLAVSAMVGPNSPREDPTPG